MYVQCAGGIDWRAIGSSQWTGWNPYMPWDVCSLVFNALFAFGSCSFV